MTITKPTHKAAPRRARRLGIAGDHQAIEELVKAASHHEDPFGFLSIHAPAAAAAEIANQQEETEETEPKAAGSPLPPLPPVPVLCSPAREPWSREFPLSDASLVGCYVSDHVEVRMSRAQAVTLRRLMAALDSANLRLENGRRPVSAPTLSAGCWSRSGTLGFRS